MNKLEKSIILQLIELVDEQQALIGDLIEEFKPTNPDTAKAFTVSVERIKLKFENCKRDINLLIGEPRCIQIYGDPPHACGFTPRWYFLNLHTRELEGPYCAAHSRQFLPEALRPIEAYPQFVEGQPAKGSEG